MVVHCSSVTLNNGEILYTSLDEKDNGLWHLTASNGTEGWESEVNMEELHKMAELSAYSADEFVDLFRRGFSVTEADKNSPGFIYKLSVTSDKPCTLSWSRYLPQDKLTLKLGSIELVSMDDISSVSKLILEGLVSQSRRQADQCRKLNAGMKEERESADTALQKLNDFVAIQEESEKMLYSNFVDVINEKKRKIRELTDECKTLRSELDNHTGNPSAEDPQPADKTKTKADPKSKQKGRAPPKRTKTTAVSACRKPRAPPRQARGQQVQYQSDSDTLEDTEEETITRSDTARKAKPLSQTDDDDSDATDIDQMETQIVASQRQVPSLRQSSQPETSGASTARSTDTKPNNSITSAAVLDDLLGREKLPTRKISPVKRKDLATAVSALQPKKANPPLPKVRKSSRISSQNDLSLLDDLL